MRHLCRDGLTPYRTRPAGPGRPRHPQPRQTLTSPAPPQPRQCQIHPGTGPSLLCASGGELVICPSVPAVRPRRQDRPQRPRMAGWLEPAALGTSVAVSLLRQAAAPPAIWPCVLVHDALRYGTTRPPTWAGSVVGTGADEACSSTGSRTPGATDFPPSFLILLRERTGCGPVVEPALLKRHECLPLTDGGCSVAA